MVSNEYTRRHGPSAVQYPWVLNRTVMEPYQEIRVDVEGTLTLTSSIDFSFALADGIYSIMPGSPVNLTLTKLGSFMLEGFARDPSSNEIILSYSEEIVCKYVRRELRQLLEDDRERLLRTMQTTYRISTSVGRQLYGPTFKSAGDFILAHNYLAGQRGCDHMHDGLGFLTLHTGLTLEYEQTLQLIDPSVVMHYWDYTIDAERVYDEGGDMRSFYNSEIFFDDWFGGVSFRDHVVVDGHFPFVSVEPSQYGIQATVKNAYGLLRSPWNANPSPFLTRCNTTYSVLQSNPPGCGWHFNQMKLTDWSQFGLEIQYRPHGKVHTMIAGVWGANWPSILEQHDYLEYNRGEALALGGFGYQKDMWRAGLLECPSSCTADTPVSSCRCHCPNLKKWIHDKAGPKIMKVADMIDEGKTTNAEGQDISEVFMRLLCNDFNDTVPQMGDLMNSGAPADPIFWTIHPTVDRLWQWRRINGMTNTSWPPSSQNYVHGGDCWGHSEDDVTIFKNLFDTDGHFYTNGELYAHMNPLNENLSTVYANFRWGHCQDVGYPIDLLPSKFIARDSSKFSGFSATDCDDQFSSAHCS